MGGRFGKTAEIGRSRAETASGDHHVRAVRAGFFWSAKVFGLVPVAIVDHLLRRNSRRAAFSALTGFPLGVG
jgi:hypothetical protein